MSGTLAEKYAALDEQQSLADKYAAMEAAAVPPAPLPTPAPAAAGVKPTALQAFGRGAGQGASLGFGDEAGGFGAWLASKMNGGNIPRAAGRGVEAALSRATDYEIARNAEREANDRAREAHKAAYIGGELVGGAAPATLAGAAVAPAGVGTVGTAALQGGALGTVSGAGNSRANTVGGVARDAAIGGATGAATGAVLAKAAPYVGKAIKKLAGKAESGAETLGEVATEQKLAGAGVERAGMKALRNRPGGLDRYAEGMERMDIGGPLTTVRGHVEQAQAAADAAGAAKDAIVQQLDDAGATVHGADVGAAIRKLKSEHGSGVGKHLEDIASEFDQMGEVPWKQMNLERKDIGAGTRWDSSSVQAKLSKKIYGKVNEAMADAAERVAPGAGKAWRAANEDEHIALKLAEMGANKLNTAGNRAISPTDYAVGATGLATGHGAVTIPAVIAHKAIRSVEHPLASAAADIGSRALSKVGGAAEAVGGALERAASGPVAHTLEESAASSAAGRVAQRISDAATKDPVYGPMVASKPPGRERDIAYSTLLTSDPAFRERERARANREQDSQQE